MAPGNPIWDGNRRRNLEEMEKVVMCVYRGDLKHFRGVCVCRRGRRMQEAEMREHKQTWELGKRGEVWGGREKTDS